MAAVMAAVDGGRHGSLEPRRDARDERLQISDLRRMGVAGAAVARG
jgi:hypothetical protein